MASAAVKPLRIGMIGGGTVGGGVYELIMGSSGVRSKRPMEIVKICVRDLSKPRSFHLNESKTTLCTNVDSILNDDTIDMVVEVMGGTTVAKNVVFTAIDKQKSVVTANKTLIAAHLSELQTLLDKNPKVSFGYEAAVCGGIPIINILQSCYSGDTIQKIQGICNGTTNYMLSKMTTEQGVEFDAVLKQAQDLGYAEMDPTDDVEGYDVRAKICILSKLAFGTTIEDPANTVPTVGITQLQPMDFEYAKLLDCNIKLLGTVERLHSNREYDGPLSVSVTPCMVKKQSSLLANIHSNGNAIAITSSNMGTCYYTGPGAGRFPTANSIVADMVRIANNGDNPAFPNNSSVDCLHDPTNIYYIRIPFADSLGIIKTVGMLSEQVGVSIHSILQTPIDDRLVADFCITTEECKQSQVQQLVELLNQQDFCRMPCLYLPIIG